jgi:hypothetical protein
MVLNMGDNKKSGGFFGFIKEVADAATKDQKEEDSVSYQIGDAMEKGLDKLRKGIK